MSTISRRDLLFAGSAAAIAPALSPLTSGRDRDRAMRFVYATDMHVQPDPKAVEGWGACLKAIEKESDKPGLILTGGDLIMDAFGASPERTKDQWDAFLKAIDEHTTIPVRHTIGNHDVFGWGNRDKHADNPRFGKAWACEVLKMEKPYCSFDQAGWHFIVLDSTFPSGGGYTAKLDDAQFAWLEADLAKTPKETPIVISSHIPILMVCAIFDGENEKSGNWVIPGSYMHIDARKITNLFLKHPNVKLCLSGHEHQVDQVVYNGVTYVCGGAVSAAWWGGNYFQCTNGYVMVDLFKDGQFATAYTAFSPSSAR